MLGWLVDMLDCLRERETGWGWERERGERKGEGEMDGQREEII